MKDREFRKEVLANLRGLKLEELAVKERDFREELFWLKFKKAGGQVEKPANVKRLRRALARIRTLQTEKARKTGKKGLS